MNASATILLVALAAPVVLRAADAPPVDVTLHLSPAEPTLADRITLTLTATVPRAPMERVLRTGHDALYTLEPPTDALRALDAWRLLDLSAEESALDAARARTVLRYTFEPRRAGPVEVPSLSVVLWPDSPEGKPAVVPTEPLAFRVRGVVDGDPLAAQPRPALPDPGPAGPGPAPGILLGVAFLAAAGLAWNRARRRRRRRAAGTAPLPGERAAALAALEPSADPMAWLTALERFRVVVAAADRAELEAAAFGRNGGCVTPELRRRLLGALRAEPDREGEGTP
jgi:hypothetical protein